MKQNERQTRPGRVKIKGYRGENRPESELKSARIQFLVGISLFIICAILGVFLFRRFTRPQPKPEAAVHSSDVTLFKGKKAQFFADSDCKIRIRSDIIGSEVWINGQFEGLTPLIIKNPAQGKYTGFVRRANSKMEKPFSVSVLEPREYVVDISFKGQALPPVHRPTVTPKPRPEFHFNVEYPRTVQFNHPFYIVVKPVKGVVIKSGELYLLPQCKTGFLKLEDVPPKIMYPYRGGLIREDLKTEFCKGPGRDTQNGALFYIIIKTSIGVKHLGSPQNPYRIRFQSAK